MYETLYDETVRAMEETIEYYGGSLPLPERLHAKARKITEVEEVTQAETWADRAKKSTQIHALYEWTVGNFTGPNTYDTLMKRAAKADRLAAFLDSKGMAVPAEKQRNRAETLRTEAATLTTANTPESGTEATGTLTPRLGKRVEPQVPTDLLDLICRSIEEGGGGLSRADLAGTYGLTPGQWNVAIASLIGDGKVIRVGQKKAARYYLPGQKVMDNEVPANEVERLFDFIEENAPATRAMALGAGFTPESWRDTIKVLVTSSRIVQEGQKRGAKYSPKEPTHG